MYGSIKRIDPSPKKDFMHTSIQNASSGPLPYECLMQIFRFLSEKELVSCAQVSPSFARPAIDTVKVRKYYPLARFEQYLKQKGIEVCSEGIDEEERSIFQGVSFDQVRTSCLKRKVRTLAALFRLNETQINTLIEEVRTLSNASDRSFFEDQFQLVKFYKELEFPHYKEPIMTLAERLIPIDLNQAIEIIESLDKQTLLEVLVRCNQFESAFAIMKKHVDLVSTTVCENAYTVRGKTFLIDYLMALDDDDDFLRRAIVIALTKNGEICALFDYLEGRENSDSPLKRIAVSALLRDRPTCSLAVEDLRALFDYQNNLKSPCYVWDTRYLMECLDEPGSIFSAPVMPVEAQKFCESVHLENSLDLLKECIRDRSLFQSVAFYLEKYRSFINFTTLARRFASESPLKSSWNRFRLKYTVNGENKMQVALLVGLLLAASSHVEIAQKFCAELREALKEKCLDLEHYRPVENVLGGFYSCIALEKVDAYPDLSLFFEFDEYVFIESLLLMSVSKRLFEVDVNSFVDRLQWAFELSKKVDMGLRTLIHLPAKEFLKNFYVNFFIFTVDKIKQCRELISTVIDIKNIESGQLELPVLRDVINCLEQMNVKNFNERDLLLYTVALEQLTTVVLEKLTTHLESSHCLKKTIPKQIVNQQFFVLKEDNQGFLGKRTGINSPLPPPKNIATPAVQSCDEETLFLMLTKLLRKLDRLKGHSIEGLALSFSAFLDILKSEEQILNIQELVGSLNARGSLKALLGEIVFDFFLQKKDFENAYAVVKKGGGELLKLIKKMAETIQNKSGEEIVAFGKELFGDLQKKHNEEDPLDLFLSEVGRFLNGDVQKFIKIRTLYPPCRNKDKVDLLVKQGDLDQAIRCVQQVNKAIDTEGYSDLYPVLEALIMEGRSKEAVELLAESLEERLSSDDSTKLLDWTLSSIIARNSRHQLTFELIEPLVSKYEAAPCLNYPPSYLTQSAYLPTYFAKIGDDLRFKMCIDVEGKMLNKTLTQKIGTVLKSFAGDAFFKKTIVYSHICNQIGTQPLCYDVTDMMIARIDYLLSVCETLEAIESVNPNYAGLFEFILRKMIKDSSMSISCFLFYFNEVRKKKKIPIPKECSDFLIFKI